MVRVSFNLSRNSAVQLYLGETPMQTNIVPFGGKLAVTPMPMLSQDVLYSQDAQRGMWDESILKTSSLMANTTYKTNLGDTGQDDAH